MQKKILIADLLTTGAEGFFYSDTFHALTPDFIDTWFYAIEYTISYYFDLSGYADMAIGLGLLFNINIPHNFNSPYKARNFQDYWRRWHMTLSRFLGDYIFRNVYKKGNKYRNYYIATMVTFFVSGFWHGAGWTFVVWGLINGLFVCTASWMKKRKISFPAPLAYCMTALGVIATRVLFISGSFSDALIAFKGMLNFQSIPFNSRMIQYILDFVFSHSKEGLVLVVGIVICWFAPNSRQLVDKFAVSKKTAIFAAVLMAICIMSMNKVEYIKNFFVNISVSLSLNSEGSHFHEDGTRDFDNDTEIKYNDFYENPEGFVNKFVLNQYDEQLKFLFCGEANTSACSKNIEALKRIKSMCDEHNVELSVVITPTFLGSRYEFECEEYYDYLKEMVSVTSYYDFSSFNDINRNPYNFLDYRHFTDAVTDEMVNQMYGIETSYDRFGVFVTEDNIDQVLEQRRNEFAKLKAEYQKTGTIELLDMKDKSYIG